MDMQKLFQDKMIIIGGLPRTGKTMMRNVVGSHSQIAVPPSEYHFFYYFDKYQYEQRGSFQANLDFFFQSCRKSKAWKLTSDMVKRKGKTRRDLYYILLDSYRQAYFPQKKYCADNSPLIEQHFDTLVEWFGREKLRFIHMARNPYNNFASYKSKMKRPSKDLVHRFCFMWAQSAGMALFRAQAYPDSYKVVFYDDFVINPDNQVKKLCHWLGVPDETERMLNMVDFENKQNSIFLKNNQKQDNKGFIRKDNYDRVKHLTEYEKHVIDHLCCFHLSKIMGYNKAEVVLNTKQFLAVCTKDYAFQTTGMVKTAMSVLSLRQLFWVALRHLAGIVSYVFERYLRRTGSILKK